MQYPDPRGEVFLLPEMPPAIDRQLRLRAFAENASTYCTMLYSRPTESAAIVSAIRTSCRELAVLCSHYAHYGQPREDVAATVAKAVEIEELATTLTATDPKMTRYYTEPIRVAMRHVVAEIQAPLPSAKARKEANA